jgi:protein-S-isoprenylcysteine O-methyltransferase Ste14
VGTVWAAVRRATQTTETSDQANVLIPPPVAWGIAFLAGLGAEWLHPLRAGPTPMPRIWLGCVVFAVGGALAIWAILTMRRAGTAVRPDSPTTAIVVNGPYRTTRNPIYMGMFLAQAGLAIGFDNVWMFATLPPLYAVIRYGVISREEAYLQRKFGTVYRDYQSRVGRWL